MESNFKIPIWLDCDPGHDDAFAILLSVHHPHLNLLGISTVHGNSSLPHTTRNALSLLTAMGTPNIPVYSGASESLTRPAVHAPAIHGESGLDGTSLLPIPLAQPMDEPAVQAMARALLSTAPQTAWLVATGSLTNIALLFSSHPELASHIKGLSIMGGAIGDDFTSAPMGRVSGEEAVRIGNWSAWAEFNVLVDPEAASQLFSNPVLSKKTTLMPLDVTHLCLATPDVQNLLLWGKDGVRNGNEGKTILRRMLTDLLLFFAKTYAEVFGITAGPPLHDPLAVAAVFDGIAGLEIPFYDFKSKGTGEEIGLGSGAEGKGRRRERYEVKIVTEGSHDDASKGAQTGRSIVRLLPEGEEGVKIPRGLNVGRFWQVLEECMERADEVNAANRTA
ncbi:Uridine nucleosidase [Lachnellula occidentalis]|uniref:Uridine nucleosidase n=1 Tax=Lachnellula occidentalis TaxID=215460 RepID=A0A8H8UJV7_9HELO|nr:Uridine nucleosidase [Lachnellula occidentalis]